METPDEGWQGTRAIALTLAVLHHGLSNLAAGSKPAGWNTTIQTATKFEEYLNTGNIPDRD